MSNDEVWWSPIDPDIDMEENIRHSPQFIHSRCLEVEVNEGDALFLPSGYFHHVKQIGDPCIAVNYWYDQEYSGERFVMRQFYSNLIDILQNNN